MPTGRELYERGIAAFSDMGRHGTMTWEEFGPQMQQDWNDMAARQTANPNSEEVRAQEERWEGEREAQQRRFARRAAAAAEEDEDDDDSLPPAFAFARTPSWTAP